MVAQPVTGTRRGEPHQRSRDPHSPIGIGSTYESFHSPSPQDRAGDWPPRTWGHTEGAQPTADLLKVNIGRIHGPSPAVDRLSGGARGRPRRPRTGSGPQDQGRQRAALSSSHVSDRIDAGDKRLGRPLRVVVIDDHEVLRAGTKQVLAGSLATVNNAEGKPEQWAIEMGGPGGLARQGWVPKTFTPHEDRAHDPSAS